jgi:hypothetical protein
MRVVRPDGVWLKRGLGAVLDGTASTRGSCCAGTPGGGAEVGVCMGKTRCGAASGIRTAAGDVSGSAWNAGVSGRTAPCPDSSGLSVGTGTEGTASVGVGSAASMDTAGDATVGAGVAGCWAVSTPAPARRLRVSGTTPWGPCSVSNQMGDGARPTIPATARTLAAAVKPRHQRGWERVALYALQTSLAMWAGMGLCPPEKPVSSRCVHSSFMTRGFPRACRTTCRTAPGVKTVLSPAPACCKR